MSSSAQQVMSDALNAETGLRGYAATGDPLFLVDSFVAGHDHVADPERDQTVTNFHHSKKIYAANRGLDRDGDHIACEAH